jgi:hypothetical protein
MLYTLFLVLAPLSLLLQECAALPSTPSAGRSQTQLDPRECSLVESEDGGFVCDNTMPTLTQIKAHMRDPAYGGKVTASSRAFFYTGLGDRTVCVPWAVGWLRSRAVVEYYWADDAVGRQCEFGSHVLETIEESTIKRLVLTTAGYAAQDRWIRQHESDMEGEGERPPLKVWRNCYVEALASVAIHSTVYLFTKADEEPGQDSIWIRIEFPALTNNPNVREIYRVDPRPPDQKGELVEHCDHDQEVLIWSRDRGDMEMTSGVTCPWR